MRLCIFGFLTLLVLYIISTIVGRLISAPLVAHFYEACTTVDFQTVRRALKGLPKFETVPRRFDGDLGSSPIMNLNYVTMRVTFCN